ncbi:type IV pilus assembly protein PilM [Tautonia sociabilis]|uniref:Type IV pilus assembly protein PilM n=1 Tax=Tautonia sociabilis TaxID=2080755 RepID=A0A432MI22_9BACT|nr:type IV pilus assembly protein PilM [Tautonia sociabilis]RUL86841.1 type IV pilus assembly protein PilM [Tautonia sociabilis]
MPKIQPVWAIDIGQAALKALKLVPGETPDHVIAEAFDYIEYPKILSQPDADPEELVREALATFLERNEVKGNRVAIGVPGQSGLVKFIKLPPVDKKRIPDIVKFEARQQIPFALEEVIWDWQEIATEGDEEFSQTEVGLFAMKREMIQRAILPFTVAGIEVDIVQMNPIALYNFIAYDRLRPQLAGEADAEGEDVPAEAKVEPAIEPGGSIVLLDIGADHTDLIISDGERIWQRNVPIGGNHFTRALTKELKLTFAKAEHLKRNATKAPDPRAVFTAMRGVFNDFSSEVQRSIGFYGSVNRQAKVVKVVGLGNGFKLPGLQKFLQQNLNMDVEKLEHFQRLAGEEVLSAPQFQENLPSFAVAYGLGVQGLGQGGLRTNLLPGEIAQARMIRAKKPLTLLAAALMLLGFSALFLGDYRALAKVKNPDFESAVAQAKQVKSTGDGFKSSYEADKGQFNTLKSRGETLAETSADGADFKSLFQILSTFIYDPREDPRFKDVDFDSPEGRRLLDLQRVHIDAIRPVFKLDLAEWFNGPELKDRMKNTMHPYDQETPPEGPGWVIEIIGHHYNPLVLREPGTGPYFFLTQRVLPNFWGVPIRRLGFSHAALAWMLTDDQWTSEKALASNSLPTNAPTLKHSVAAPTGGAAGGMAGMMGMEAMMPGMEGMEGMYGGRGMGMEGMEGMMPGMMGGMSGMMGGMESMYGMRGGRSSAFGRMPGMGNEPEMEYLTRTDFVIYVVWQPPTEEKPAKEPAELIKALREAEDKYKGKIQAPDLEDLKAFEEESAAESEQSLQQLQAPAAGAETAPAAGAATTAPAEGGTPPAETP